MTDLRIVFMGTPDFAVASLEALVKNGYNVVGVITAPDKPAGRGMKLQQSAVKQFALQHNLQILQPEKLKSPAFIDELRSLQADLQIVVAFRMLPEVVWAMPPMGTLNVHGSLLPQYRGAAPINWAIINGEKETGVTTFRLKHQIDTGDVLLQETMPIAPNEMAGEVHDRMKVIGAEVLVKTVEGLVNNSIVPKPQSSFPEDQIKHAPKIFSDDCRLDFNQPAIAVHNRIRGLSPFPGAFTYLGDKMLKIYRSEVDVSSVPANGQAIETDGKTSLRFRCADGYVLVKELQLEGKKRMTMEEFLRGYKGLVEAAAQAN